MLTPYFCLFVFFFFFQAEDGIRDYDVTGVQTCALPIWSAEVDECGVCGGDGSSCGGSTVSLEIQNVNLTDGTLDIYMTNDVPVAAFEFLIEGISSTGISGGYAELSGFEVFINGNSTRSEEHTSELQSRRNLVCRLLLEKKKN